MKILKFKGDYSGLDNEAVREKLDTYGRNTEVKPENPRTVKFYNVFKHLRLYLMLAAAGLYLLGGVVAPGVLLLLLGLGYCVFEILIENHCDKKLRELNAGATVTVRAVREGAIALVERGELVQDDLIVLQGGESVPADAHILEATNVTADESVFSGSSTSVKKQSGADSKAKNELKSTCIYKGTKILSGILIARIFATGQDVKIRPKVVSARQVHRTEFESLIKKVTTLFTTLAAIALTAVAVIRVVSVQIPDTETSLLEHFSSTVLPAFSFALCLIPVSLALIVRVYYANAAVKLSQKYGEIKNLGALETLNSVTTVCLGRNSIVDVDNTPIAEEVGENKPMLARIAALSCGRDAANSYEKAIYVNAAFHHINIDELQQNLLIQRYVPEKTSNYNKMNGNLWEVNGARLLCIKGEPEIVLSYCKMPADKLFQVQEKRSQLSQKGYSVMAVAFAQLKQNRPLADNSDSESDCDADSDVIATEYTIPENICELEYVFLGLMAFTMNIKDKVAEAVQNCSRAGVRIVMITPDSKETARAIAAKIGLTVNFAKTVTGGDLEKAKADNRVAEVRGVSIFAGVSGEQKAEVITLLKAAGEKTAVFGGDGGFSVNAMELADVKISLAKNTTGNEWDYGQNTLSQHTTGSTCEICDLIMESGCDDGDGFAKAAETIREARQLHANIKRCITVGISTFMAIALFGFLNLFVGGGGIFVLEAIFVSVLTILIVPALTLFFADNELDLNDLSYSKMRPSPFIGRGEISRPFLYGAAIQGASLLAVLFIMFAAFGGMIPVEQSSDVAINTAAGGPKFNIEQIRAIFLTTFMSAGIMMAWVGLSAHEPFYKSFILEALKKRGTRGVIGNPVVMISGGLFLFTLLVIHLPYVNSAFGVQAPGIGYFIIAVLAGALSQVWYDFIKKRFTA